MRLSCWPICPIRILRHCRRRVCSSSSASGSPATSIGSASGAAFPSRDGARADRRRSQGAATRPHRGHRRSDQHRARRRNFAPARAWLESLGPPQDVTARAGQSRRLCARRRGGTRSAIGATTCAATSAGGVGVSVRAPARAAGADRLSTRGADAAVPGDRRLGAEQFARLARCCSTSYAGLFRVVLIHHPPLSRPTGATSG